MVSILLLLTLPLVDLVACAASAEETNICGKSEVKYDTTCAKDCSEEHFCTKDCTQNVNRIPGENDTFNCTIGGKNDVDNFHKFNKMKMAILDPPKMIGINFFHKSYDDEPTPSPSLAINFLLPKAVPNPVKEDFIYPDAILMKFQSVSVPEVQDWFYYHCPRERIFRFHDYKPSLNFDADNPRNITFKCLVGLNNSAPMRVYLITLQSFPGHSVIYMVTVYVMSLLRELETWKPAIVTHFNDTEKSIYTVFEEAPEGFIVNEYIVQLSKHNHGEVEVKRLKPSQHSATFYNIIKGNYQVKVSVDGKLYTTSGIFVNTTSYYIDTSHLPGDNEGKGTWKMVAMVIGCVLGVLLILAIIIWQKRRQKNRGQEPCWTGFILHPFNSNTDTEYFKKMEDFRQYLQDTCKCSLLPNTGRPSDDLTTVQGLIKQNLCNSSFVIVVYTRDCYKENAEPPDYFSCALKEIMNRRKQKNDLRIIPVTFPFSCPVAKPEIIAEFETYNLMTDMEKVYCRIYGEAQVPLEIKEKILRNELYGDLNRLEENVSEPDNDDNNMIETVTTDLESFPDNSPLTKLAEINESTCCLSSADISYNSRGKPLHEEYPRQVHVDGEARCGTYNHLAKLEHNEQDPRWGQFNSRYQMQGWTHDQRQPGPEPVFGHGNVTQGQFYGHCVHPTQGHVCHADQRKIEQYPKFHNDNAHSWRQLRQCMKNHNLPQHAGDFMEMNEFGTNRHCAREYERQCHFDAAIQNNWHESYRYPPMSNDRHGEVNIDEQNWRPNCPFRHANQPITSLLKSENMGNAESNLSILNTNHLSDPSSNPHLFPHSADFHNMNYNIDAEAFTSAPTFMTGIPDKPDFNHEHFDQDNYPEHFYENETPYFHTMDYHTENEMPNASDQTQVKEIAIKFNAVDPPKKNKTEVDIDETVNETSPLIADNHKENIGTVIQDLNRDNPSVHSLPLEFKEPVCSTLLNDFDSFQPVPPKDDDDDCGDISSHMEEMIKINSNRFVS